MIYFRKICLLSKGGWLFIIFKKCVVGIDILT